MVGERRGEKGIGKMRNRAILLIFILLSGIPAGGLGTLPASDFSPEDWSVTDWSAQSGASSRDGNDSNGSGGNGSGGNGSGDNGGNGSGGNGSGGNGSGDVTMNISTATTSATLALVGNFSATTTVNGTWSASLASNLAVGSNLLNNSSLRLDQQIDLHLGDNDSNLSSSEWQAFADLFSAHNLSTLDGRVWLDDNSFSSSAGITFSDVNLSADLPQAVGLNSTWHWNESGAVSVNRGFLPSALLAVNQADGAMHSTPLTVTTQSPVEYRWSPDQVEVIGNPTNFTVFQNVTESGTYTVTIAPNTAPVVAITQPDAEAVAIRWAAPFVFSGSVQDAGLVTTECGWNFTTPSGSYLANGVVVILEPNTVEAWQPGEYMVAEFSCIDFHAQSTSTNHTWGLDAAAPVMIWVNATVGCGGDDLEVALENILNCDTISIPSSERLAFYAVVGDDFTSNPDLLWSSNKTADWWQAGVTISTVFYQGPQINGYDDPLPDRHFAKQNSTFILNLTVTDDAGHTALRSWTVRLFDNTPPTTKINLWVDDLLVTGSSPARVGKTIRVDLNESFDDIDAVTDVRWWAMVDDEPISELQDVGWAAIREFEIGPLAVGFHQLKISAEDTSGNRAENNSYDIQVYPLSVLDLSIVNVTVVDVDEWVVAPGEVAVIVWVNNQGALVAGFRVCVAQQCSNQTALAANPDGAGFSSHYVKFDMSTGDDLVVRIEWEDEDGTFHSKTFDTEVRVDQPYSTVEWFGIIVATLGIVGLLYWLKTKATR